MITITQESKDLYRAEYSAPEAPAFCAEDFYDVEYGDTDLTAALKVQRGIDDQEDADAVWSACAKLRTCHNCTSKQICNYRHALIAMLERTEIRGLGCNAWERKT